MVHSNDKQQNDKVSYWIVVKMLNKNKWLTRMSKRSMIENINDKNAQLEQDPLVTKFRGCLSIKRLQSLSENQNYRGLACSHANPNLIIPFSNVDLNDNKV
ncbi:30603_t:CDS:2 [Gigaspora margarita]|uniref:30603_t:CDS:1 n=1 Tax=Gigaspora margarita TaxID=4874 RepID=A0ABN7URE9_GIGMA|nr:30603_t:CDS:2 [Gigaspora margarita]